LARTSLQCRECKKEYESTFKYICDDCFGPLDVKYDFPTVTKDTFSNREQTYWRYFELLPIEDKSNIVSIDAGMTPLSKAEKLGEKLGLKFSSMVESKAQELMPFHGQKKQKILGPGKFFLLVLIKMEQRTAMIFYSQSQLLIQYQFR